MVKTKVDEALKEIMKSNKEILKKIKEGEDKDISLLELYMSYKELKKAVIDALYVVDRTTLLNLGRAMGQLESIILLLKEGKTLAEFTQKRW